MADPEPLEPTEAELKMKRDVRDDKYVATNAQRSAWASRVTRITATTARTTLAMGFVRKSEKKSGLTRKKKP